MDSPTQSPHPRTDDVVPQPDWETESDAAFLKAARAVFAENAELLRRLA